MFSLLHPFRHSSDLAVDFGTAVLRTGDAEGTRLHNVPSSAGTRPALRDGVVIDPEAATEVLHGAFREFGTRRNLRVLACAPSDASEDERSRLLTALHEAGAATSALIPEPVAAMVGAGVDLGSGAPHMVIDFGEGVADCAVAVGKQLHSSVTLRGGCSALRAGLIAYLLKTAGIRVNSAQAEQLIRQKNSHLQKEMHFCSPISERALVHDFLHRQTDKIVEVLLAFIEKLPAAICTEVISNGIAVTGGGALIPGFVSACRQKSGLPLNIARRPLDAVIDGACSILGPATRFDLWGDLRNFWNTQPCSVAGLHL